LAAQISEQCISLTGQLPQPRVLFPRL
jgi:hypothetical protein